MAKDKQASSFSMNDYLHETYDPKQNQQDSINSNLDTFNIDESEFKSVIEYNKNITNLDEDYTKLTPVYDVLVRVFAIEPEITKEGIYIPHTEVLAIPTKNGMANLYEVPSPFPYSTKAVVVSSCDDKFKQGDIVQVAPVSVKPLVQGTAENAIVVMPKGYVHPDSKLKQVPKDITSKHYGYILVAPFDVKIKF